MQSCCMRLKLLNKKCIEILKYIEAEKKSTGKFSQFLFICNKAKYRQSNYKLLKWKQALISFFDFTMNP